MYIYKQIQNADIKECNYELIQVVGVGGSLGHHNLKLVEVDGATAIDVDAADHLPAIIQGAFLAEAAEHVEQLLGGDGAVLVDVEDGEGVLQILQHLLVVHVAGVELDEFLQIDESVAVRVHLPDHDPHLLLRHRVPQAPHDRPQLRRADLPVPVRVEFPEHVLQFLVDPHRRRSRLYERLRRRCRFHREVALLLLLLLLLEQRFESHHKF